MVGFDHGIAFGLASLQPVRVDGVASTLAQDFFLLRCQFRLGFVEQDALGIAPGLGRVDQAVVGQLVSVHAVSVCSGGTRPVLAECQSA